MPGATTGIYNQGTVTASGLADVLTDDPNTHAIDDPTYTSIALGPPELRVTKSAILAVDADNNNVLSPGDTLQYIVAINNNGGSAADNITFTRYPGPQHDSGAGQHSVSLPADDSRRPLFGHSRPSGPWKAGPPTASAWSLFMVTINNPFTANTGYIIQPGRGSADGIGPIRPMTPIPLPAPMPRCQRGVCLSTDDSHQDRLHSYGCAAHRRQPGRHFALYGHDYQFRQHHRLVSGIPGCITDPHLTLALNSVTTTAGTIVTGNASGDKAVEVNIGRCAGRYSGHHNFQSHHGRPVAPGVTGSPTRAWSAVPTSPACPPMTPTPCWPMMRPAPPFLRPI